MIKCLVNILGPISGGVALLLLLALVAYPIYRRKAPQWGFRFGNMRRWRTWHLALGAGFGFFLLLHVAYRQPGNDLAFLLWWASLLALFGGVLWVWVQWYVPQQLAKLARQNQLFESRGVLQRRSAHGENLLRLNAKLQFLLENFRLAHGCALAVAVLILVFAHVVLALIF